MRRQQGSAPTPAQPAEHSEPVGPSPPAVGNYRLPYAKLRWIGQAAGELVQKIRFCWPVTEKYWGFEGEFDPSGVVLPVADAFQIFELALDPGCVMSRPARLRKVALILGTESENKDIPEIDDFALSVFDDILRVEPILRRLLRGYRNILEHYGLEKGIGHLHTESHVFLENLSEIEPALLVELQETADQLITIVEECESKRAELTKQPAPRDALTEARDKWIYDRCCDLNIPLKNSLSDLKKQFPTARRISSIQSLRAAAIRYAANHELPELPRRR